MDLPFDRGLNRLAYLLRGLPWAAPVLHLGAHPGDEEAGLLAYLARGLGVRTVYWSATRGEGGRNRLNSYQGPALGVYRTWESLAARSIDGAEALFGPFVDFGFSKSGALSLAKWGRSEVVREIVRAIRSVQPVVVIARWSGDDRAGHGQGQAVGQAALEAFAAAGQAEAFPELAGAGLLPWRPGKLYVSLSPDSQAGQGAGGAIPAPERPGLLRLDAGQADPISGRSFHELGLLALNQHRTQGLGLVPQPGPVDYYYKLLVSRVPAPERESSFFDGLDPSLTGLADCPGWGGPDLRAALGRIKALLETAWAAFHPARPEAATEPLWEAQGFLQDLLGRPGLNPALAQTLGTKLGQVDEALTLALGLRLDCLAETARLCPGQKVQVAARLWTPGRPAPEAVKLDLVLAEGWTARRLTQAQDGPAADFEVEVPPGPRFSCPYWLTQPHLAYRYRWPEGEPLGAPLGRPVLKVWAQVGSGRRRLLLTSPAVSRQAIPGGHRELPLAVLPPVAVQPRTSTLFLPLSQKPRRVEFRAKVQAHAPLAGERVDLLLQAPSDWPVAPAEVEFALGPPGEATALAQNLTIPGGAPAEANTLLQAVRLGEREYAISLQAVRQAGPGQAPEAEAGSCLREEFIISPASVEVLLVDAKFVPGLRIGYVRGAEEGIVEALGGFNLDLRVLDDETLLYGDLVRFDVLVVGPHAYLLRSALRAAAGRVLEYAVGGGTVLVQSQDDGFDRPGLAPYPLGFGRPPHRVTDERAEVTILQPGHPVFAWPNRITAADFEGWVHDRGAFFPETWDERYRPLLACADPGEPPRRGGLLLGETGRGRYLYCAYSLFRQLPAGVPGAFRFMANLLSLPLSGGRLDQDWAEAAR